MPLTLDPELLRSFVAIAETGGFTRAAERVHRTQSAVSMQIKRLEETLGQPLFERDGRSITLTPQGEMLLDHARRILRAHLEAIAAFDSQAVSGHVRFGSPDDYASTFLPGILARFARTHPHVHVEMVVDRSTRLVEMLAAGDVDMGLVSEGSGETGGVVISRQQLVWVTSALHCVHDEDPVPLAAFETGCCFRRYATETLIRAGRPFRIAYSSVSLSGILAAVETGLAVGTVMRTNIKTGLRILTEADGFPSLPEVGITLLRSPHAAGCLVDRLEEHVLASCQTCPPLTHAA
ncbi:MAG: LysR family transcriptional regulator [Geminicoccaceae bacterium]|nr:LysR family transcriptional regulator [Geminicoccaceae bacterium]